MSWSVFALCNGIVPFYDISALFLVLSSAALPRRSDLLQPAFFQEVTKANRVNPFPSSISLFLPFSSYRFYFYHVEATQRNSFAGNLVIFHRLSYARPVGRWRRYSCGTAPCHNFIRLHLLVMRSDEAASLYPPNTPRRHGLVSACSVCLRNEATAHPHLHIRAGELRIRQVDLRRTQMQANGGRTKAEGTKRARTTTQYNTVRNRLDAKQDRPK